jgi:hypothetical protein
MTQSKSIFDVGDRGTRLGAAAGAVLLMSLLICYFAMNNARSAAADAASDYLACEQEASTIASLRKASLGPVVSGASKPMEEITGRIEAAASAANLPPNDIKAVSPQQAQRIPDSPYNRVPTQIEIGGATLAQTTAFIGELCGDESGLRLVAVHLASDTSAGPGNAPDWTSDLTVTYTTTASATNAANP